MRAIHSPACLVSLSWLLILSVPVRAEPLLASEESFIDASPAAVWRVIGDFGAFGQWHSGVQQELSDQPWLPGDIRTVSVDGSLQLNEQLIRRDPVNYTLVWTLVGHTSSESEGQSPASLTPLAERGYSMRVSLTARSTGNTQVVWEVQVRETEKKNQDADEQLLADLQQFMVSGLGNLSTSFDQDSTQDSRTASTASD